MDHYPGHPTDGVGAARPLLTDQLINLRRVPTSPSPRDFVQIPRGSQRERERRDDHSTTTLTTNGGSRTYVAVPGQGFHVPQLNLLARAS